MSGLSHVDNKGQVRMVDVTEKDETFREAVAVARLKMNPGTMKLIREGRIEKGVVLETARIAGIMGAKRTSDLIPLCHPLLINGVEIDFDFVDDSTLLIRSTVKTTGKTGVEMEALTGAAIASLTVYDMCKAVDKDMIIEEAKLVKKTGGKSGTYIRREES